MGSLCPHSRTRASGWWGVLGAPLLILRVNDLPCGALKTTTPSPGPLTLHQDLCHLKPTQPRDQQTAEPLGSKASRAGLPSLPPSAPGSGGQRALKMRRGLEGRVRRWGACGVHPELGLPVCQRPGTHPLHLEPPAGREPLEAVCGLLTLLRLSSADQVLSLPRRGAPGAPPLQGPLLPVPSTLGSPCLEGCLPFLPHTVTSNHLSGLCSEPVLRDPQAGAPLCLPLRDSASPRGPLQASSPGHHRTLSAFPRS